MKIIYALTLLFAAAPLSAAEQQSSAPAMKQEQSAAEPVETIESLQECRLGDACKKCYPTYIRTRGNSRLVAKVGKKLASGSGSHKYSEEYVVTETITTSPGVATTETFLPSAARWHYYNLEERFLAQQKQKTEHKGS